MSPPSDWPAAPISCGSSRPENESPGRALSASSLVRTYDISCGWFTRSASYCLGAEVAVGPREVHRGDHVSGAGPGPQQVRVPAPGHCRNPGANNSSGNGPAGPRAPGIPELGHQCALAEMLVCRACVGGIGKCHLPLSGPVAAVDGGMRPAAQGRVSVSRVRPRPRTWMAWPPAARAGPHRPDTNASTTRTAATISSVPLTAEVTTGCLPPAPAWSKQSYPNPPNPGCARTLSPFAMCHHPPTPLAPSAATFWRRMVRPRRLPPRPDIMSPMTRRPPRLHADIL